MLLVDVFHRIKYYKTVDRIGPDVPLHHWKLHFKSSMKKLCIKMFYHFGDNAEFRPGAYAITCSKISIGKNVIIRPGVMLFADPRNYKEGKIIIEDDVMMGSGVHIYVSNHRFDRTDIPILEQGHYPPKNVILKKGCWIGANCIILSGVEIGPNSVIGAGSIVTKSIPGFSLAVGNPARVIRKLK